MRKQRTLKLTRKCLLGAMLFGLSAQACDCNASAEKEGQRGYLKFSYRTALSDEDFDRPIAKNASLTVRVEGTKDERIRVLHDVKSSSNAIGIKRSSSSSNLFILRGQSRGASTISVKATADRLGTVTDLIKFSVMPVDYIEMEHVCTQRSEAAYIQGSPIRIESIRYDLHERPLVGEQGCAVGFDQPYIKRIDCSESVLTLAPVSQPGPVKIYAQEKNGKIKRHALTAHIVDAALVELDISENDLTVDTHHTISLLTSTKNWQICNSIAFDVHILTPSTCTLGATGDTYGRYGSGNNNTFTLVGESSGECSFNVSLPEYGRADVWAFDMDVYEADDDDDDDFDE